MALRFCEVRVPRSGFRSMVSRESVAGGRSFPADGNSIVLILLSVLVAGGRSFPADGNSKRSASPRVHVAGGRSFPADGNLTVPACSVIAPAGGRSFPADGNVIVLLRLRLRVSALPKDVHFRLTETSSAFSPSNRCLPEAVHFRLIETPAAEGEVSMKSPAGGVHFRLTETSST